MEIHAKKFTDNNGDVWITLYEEGHMKEPLVMLRSFEINKLMLTIQNELDGWDSASEVPQENAPSEG